MVFLERALVWGTGARDLGGTDLEMSVDTQNRHGGKRNRQVHSRVKYTKTSLRIVEFFVFPFTDKYLEPAGPPTTHPKKGKVSAKSQNLPDCTVSNEDLLI